jgi:hypothetical protein
VGSVVPNVARGWRGGQVPLGKHRVSSFKCHSTNDTHLSLTVDTIGPSAAAVPSPATDYIRICSVKAHIRENL